MFLLSKVNVFIIFLMKQLQKLSDWIGSEYSEGKYRANIALGTILQVAAMSCIILWLLTMIFVRPFAVIVCALVFAIFIATAVLLQRATQKVDSRKATTIFLLDFLAVFLAMGIFMLFEVQILALVLFLVLIFFWPWRMWHASYFGWGFFKKSKQKRDAAAQAGQQAHAANHAQQFPAAPPAGYSGPQPGQPHQPDVGPPMTQRFGEPPRHNPTPQPPQGHTSGDEWGLPPH